MTLDWDFEDSPSPPPHPAPHRPRRRTVLAALSGLALLTVAGIALVSLQRRARLAEAERAVLAMAELEQQALAADDWERYAVILPPGISRERRIRLAQAARLQLPGVTVVGNRGRPETVRFRASRAGLVLDQAEVDVATVISDAYGTAQVLRRQQFAQAENGQWQLQPKGDLKHPIAEPEPWVGIVLTTTVKAEDAALGMVLHDSLDADLAAFCAAAQAAGRLMAWNTCTFQLLSDGLPVKLDRRGIQTGVAVHLPSPPGGLVPSDDAGRTLLRRAYLREMIARWQGRDRSLVIETLLAVWLAPNAAALAADGVPRDWDQLERDLQFDALATEHGAEARHLADSDWWPSCSASPST